MNNYHSAEFRSLLALALSPCLTAFRKSQLLEMFSSAQAIQQTDRARLLAHGLKEPSVEKLLTPDWAAVDKHIQWAEQNPLHHIVLLTDAHYPKMLREIADPPLALFVIGHLACLNTPQIAMVGSRSPSFSGRDNAYAFAHSLTQAGLTITSGLAVGIDSASHRGTIAANGNTIAVFGTGIDVIYPSCQRNLAENIIAKGALVSEFPLGTKPLRQLFPQRNRIVSGLSLGTLVVEATTRSGSLITARLAAEQGRDVFAIPGSIHSPTSQGCHQLLRNGAKLVTTTADILEELAHFLPAFTSNPPKTTYNKVKSPLELADTKLLECLGYETATLDMLAERSGLGVEEIASRMLNMELDGYIYTTPTGYLRVTI